MKILCTCIPAIGHFEPLLPLAHALSAAGHEVRFATAAGFHHEIEAKGYVAHSAGLDLGALIAASEASAPQGLRPDQKAGRMFARIAPRAMLEPLLAVGREWRPDVLVHEEGEYTAPLAAHLLGVPNICVAWPSPVRAEQQFGMLDRILADYWREAGAEPIAHGGMFRWLFLDPCPPTLQTPFGLALPNARRIRPVVLDDGPAPAKPDWLAAMPPGRVVHVTFGTVAIYNDAPELFRAVMAGAKDVNLVVTVGKNNDPADLGPQPANVHVARFLPHSELLPHCDAVISHGGPGSTVKPLAHGLPLVVIPGGGAAQRRLGDACAQAGVGLTVEREAVTPAALRDSLDAVLNVAGYRARARAMAEEIRGMPAPSEAVEAIEALAGAR